MCGLVTVKSAALVVEPPTVVTVIGPVIAPVGTLVTIVVDVALVIEACTPLNEAVAVEPKLVPVIVTTAPTGPLVGVNPEIVGGGGIWTMSTVLSLIGPDAAVIVTEPVVSAEAAPAVSIVATV
jgi:hypothetical protein